MHGVQNLHPDLGHINEKSKWFVPSLRQVFAGFPLNPLGVLAAIGT